MINKESSILASSGMCWFIWFLTWSGLSYSTEPLCNEWIDHTRAHWLKFSFWFIMFCLTTIRGGYKLGSAEHLVEEK